MTISIVKQVLLAAFVVSLSAQAQPDSRRADTSTVTVSQRDQDVARQKAEDQKKAQELLTEARKLWKEGKLQQAIAKVAQAQKIVGKDKEITKTLKAMQRQKKDLDSRLREAEKLIHKDKFKEAQKVLDRAARINDKYEKYKEVLNQLADAKEEAKEKEKQIAKLLKDAKVLKSADKLDEAVTVLKKGSKQFPGNREIGKLLKEVQKQQENARKKMAEGQRQWKSGLLNKAVLTLREAVKIDPSNGQIAKVLKAMQGQKKTIDETLKKADQRIGQKKFDQAEGVLKKAGRISRQYLPYKNMLKKLDIAKHEAEKNKRDERLANILLKQAKDFWNAGKLDDAIVVLTKGSREFPDNKKIIQSLQNVQQAQAESLKLPLPETIPFLTLFRLNAVSDPNAAFGKYADTHTAEKLRNLGTVLSPISDPSFGWQLFFGTSIVAIASLSEQIVLTMFYNPWADIVLLCEWTRLGVSPKITQVKLICGDEMRNSEISVLLPLWRRTGDAPPPAAALVASSDTMQAFINLYGKRPKWAAQQWPKKLTPLKTDNPRKDNKKIVGIFFSQNLSSISTFFNDPTYTKLKISMDKIRQQLLAGKIEDLLVQAPETLRENRTILSNLKPEYWRHASVVSMTSDSRHAFVFLSRFTEPQLFASFWFDLSADGDVALRRIDFFSYSLSLEAVDKLARKAGMKRPLLVYGENGGNL